MPTQPLDTHLRLASVQAGRPRSYGREGAQDPHDQPWSTGFFKEPVEGPVRLALTNLDGDGQADLSVHGGPDKAVLAYAAAHYPAWREELHIAPLPHGAFGENFTVEGTDERTVAIGDTYQVGEALVQVSQPRAPCWKLARRWRRHDLPARVVKSGRTGWYFRVLREGVVESGQELRLRERPFPEWTIQLLNQLAYRQRDDLDAVARLAECPLLSEEWRRPFAEAVGL